MGVLLHCAQRSKVLLQVVAVSAIYSTHSNMSRTTETRLTGLPLLACSDCKRAEDNVSMLGSKQDFGSG